MTASKRTVNAPRRNEVIASRNGNGRRAARVDGPSVEAHREGRGRGGVLPRDGDESYADGVCGCAHVRGQGRDRQGCQAGARQDGPETEDEANLRRVVVKDAGATEGLLVRCLTFLVSVLLPVSSMIDLSNEGNGFD